MQQQITFTVTGPEQIVSRLARELEDARVEDEGLTIHTAGGTFAVDVVAVGAVLERKTPAPEFKSQAARDAQASGYGSATYPAYLERHALELAERFPERAEEFMTRSLGEALTGNNGD